MHGRPTSALFHNERVVPGKTSFELSWEVESFVPIREYRLLYRMIEVVVSLSQILILIEWLLGAGWTSIQLLTEPFQQIKGRVERDSATEPLEPH